MKKALLLASSINTTYLSKPFKRLCLNTNTFTFLLFLLTACGQIVKSENFIIAQVEKNSQTVYSEWGEENGNKFEIRDKGVEAIYSSNGIKKIILISKGIHDKAHLPQVGDKIKISKKLLNNKFLPIKNYNLNVSNIIILKTN